MVEKHRVTKPGCENENSAARGRVALTSLADGALQFAAAVVNLVSKLID